MYWVFDTMIKFMAKKDLFKGLIAGFFMGLFFIPVLENLELSIQQTFPWFQASNFYFLPLGIPILIAIWLYFTSWIGKRRSVFFQIGKFVTVGSLNASIYLGLLNLLMLITWVDARNTYLYAFFVAVCALISICNSYFWNKVWTFKKELKLEGKEFLKFLFVSGIGIAINMAITLLFAKIIGPMIGAQGSILSGLIAPVIGILVEAIWNFTIYKFFIFKHVQLSLI